MCFKALYFLFLLINFCSGDYYYDPLSAESTCVLEMDFSTLKDFPNCTFNYNGYLPFEPMTIPICPYSNNSIQCFTPQHTDSGLSCLNYEYDIGITNKSEITIDFWYHDDEGVVYNMNYITVGFMIDETSWFFESDNIASLNSAEWQKLTIGPFDAVEGKLVIYGQVENALFCVDKITITNVDGSCGENPDEAMSILKVDPEPPEVVEIEEGNSCYYNFSDGQMHGLESCTGWWVDFGSKVIQLPSCEPDERRYVLTQKSLYLPSKTQTIRALKLSADTEIFIRFWYEIQEDYKPNRNALIISLVSDGESANENQILAEWKVIPQNRIWQTASLQLNGAVDTSNKIKIAIDIGLKQQRIFIDYIIITKIENPEDCYEAKAEGSPPCE